jgi:hypothetical protein
MAKKNSTKDLFKRLKIKESEYLPYSDPEQFALGIKKCSLLESHEIRYSNTTTSEERKNG